MKTWLILIILHASHNASPVIQVMDMPSLETCERVAAKIKKDSLNRFSKQIAISHSCIEK